MSDNELDKLFKEAAEGYTTPFDADAWKDMEGRLNTGTVKPTNAWVKRSIVIFSIAVVVGTVWLTGGLEFTNEETLTGNELIEKGNEKELENEAGISPELHSEKEVIRNQESTARIDLPVNSERPSKAKRITGYVNQIQNNLGSITPSKQESTTVISLEIQKDLASPLAVSTENQQAENITSKVATSSSDSVATIQEELVMVSVDSANQVAKKKSSENKNASGGWSICISASPDFSSIKFFTPYPSGFNYGFQIGYAFHAKWSASIGLINSKKIYASEDIEDAYTTGGGYDYPVTKLEGDCRVLDIPLNLYYTVVAKKSFSLKTGVGFSSYLMKSEDYTYYVDKPYGDNVYESSIKGENNEWFKILNISLLVDKKINNRFAFELEPFVKVPLAGIGEGKVSLVTIGAFCSLRYNLFVNP